MIHDTIVFLPLSSTVNPATTKRLKASVARLSLLLIPLWIGSHLSSLAHPLDLLSNFRQPLLHLALVVLALNLVLRNRATAGWCGLAVFTLASGVVPWAMPESNTHGARGELKIYHANVWTANEDHQRVLRQIEEEQPDIIALLEVNGRWMRALESLRETHPHHKLLPQEDNFGLALYSKLPLQEIQVLRFSTIPVDSLSAVVTLPEGEKLLLCLTHPVPPVSKAGFSSRNAALESMGQYLGSRGEPRVLLGDLNTAMWSHHYLGMESTSGMRNARRGFGVLGSWPADGWVRIPIDHCLVSPEIGVKGFRLLPSNGSDHLPFIAELTY